jgi:uncharacterized membrane protein YkvA (DUF1232 family)
MAEKKGTRSAAAGRSSRTPTRVSKADAKKEAERARKRADDYRNDPEKTRKLLKDAQAKANKRKGPISAQFDDLMTLVRLIRAYFGGEYKEVPWETIALALGAVIYFVSPVDLIPDFIPVAGYVDDAAVIAFVIASLKNDLDNFRDWEHRET